VVHQHGDGVWQWCPEGINTTDQRTRIHVYTYKDEEDTRNEIYDGMQDEVEVAATRLDSTRLDGTSLLVASINHHGRIAHDVVITKLSA
jgi:hypothetical protein